MGDSTLRAGCRFVALRVSCALIMVLAGSPPGSVSAAVQPETVFDTILEPFNRFDPNQDGTLEIESIGQLPGFERNPTPDSQRLLLILVESRVWDYDRQSGDPQLPRLFSEYRRCLERDGWTPVFCQANVYSGEIHQDGRTVLALRRLFQSIRGSYPNFGGAVLVGSFPESMLVRRWVWKHDQRQVTFNGTTYNQQSGPQATFLAMDPELISHRSDVVLCDLDGDWEAIYVQLRTHVESIKLLPSDDVTSQPHWPVLEQTIRTDRFSIVNKTFEDFFFIDDANFQIVDRTDSQLTIQCDYEMLRPEVAEVDRQLPNPLAMPEIMVSRINPRNIAVSQPERNLDAQGRPRAVSKSGGSPNEQFVTDAALEHRLLIEYFERNLSHRQGKSDPAAKQVATMWTDLQTPSKAYFSRLAKPLGGLVSFPKADAVDFVRFLKTPAIMKGISAHSNPACSVLMKGYKADDLDRETGGGYWFWKSSGEQYVPSYDHTSVRDRIHFSLLRTLWENGQLRDAGPCFFVHGGCEAISPAGAATHPYQDPGYAGHNQIAESLLFYGNGLALIGRAKVYFDIPRGLDESFGADHGRFGDILTGYFAVEAHDAKLAGSVASRNRTYFWSVIGDWTLRLEYPLAPQPAIDSEAAGVYLLRSDRLEWIEKQAEGGNAKLQAAIDKLISEADALLEKPAVSVADNPVVPPSGDPRDYMSFGPYWWPNPDSADGLPYINRDGEVNPESRANGSDRAVLAEMVHSVDTLALAYRLQADPRYAAKAVEFLEVFFLDAERHMNPNLNFGQAIPGRVSGRGIGIIDTRLLPQVVDAIGLLKPSDALTEEIHAGLQDWFSQYLNWLRTSQYGIDERNTRNNHGTYYDVQVISFALFTEQHDLAREAASRSADRIRSQIGADGGQPEELKRTRSYSYSLMNLRGLYQLARLAEHVDVDLWHVTLPGQPPQLLRAYQFMEPHFRSLKDWPNRQLGRDKRQRIPANLILEARRAFAGEFLSDDNGSIGDRVDDVRSLIR